MIRVAGSTFAFGNISLEKSCDILKELGFDLADIGASGWSSFAAYVPQQVVQNPDEPEREAENIRGVMDTKDHEERCLTEAAMSVMVTGKCNE